jgi:hypothetical protein
MPTGRPTVLAPVLDSTPYDSSTPGK